MLVSKPKFKRTYCQIGEGLQQVGVHTSLRIVVGEKVPQPQRFLGRALLPIVLKPACALPGHAVPPSFLPSRGDSDAAGPKPSRAARVPVRVIPSQLRRACRELLCGSGTDNGAGNHSLFNHPTYRDLRRTTPNAASDSKQFGQYRLMIGMENGVGKAQFSDEREPAMLCSPGWYLPDRYPPASGDHTTMPSSFRAQAGTSSSWMSRTTRLYPAGRRRTGPGLYCR